MPPPPAEEAKGEAAELVAKERCKQKEKNEKLPRNLEVFFSNLFNITVFNILLYILSLSPIINIYQPSKIILGQCEI
jgi:hypothetical protein